MYSKNALVNSNLKTIKHLNFFLDEKEILLFKNLIFTFINFHWQYLQL